MFVIPEWKSQSKTVGELKDRSIEIHILNTEEKIKKKKKKKKNSLRDLETTKISNICVIKISKIKVGSISRLTKDNLYIILAQQTPKRINPKKCRPRLIMVKLLKTKSKEKV